MSENQWRTIFVIASAVVSFLLVQEDVQIEGIWKVTLGAINVALTAVAPARLARGGDDA